MPISLTTVKRAHRSVNFIVGDRGLNSPARRQRSFAVPALIAREFEAADILSALVRYASTDEITTTSARCWHSGPRFYPVFLHIRRAVHNRNADPFCGAWSRPANFAVGSPDLVRARSAHRRRARQHDARRRWLLSLGRPRVRPILGVSKRLADLGVLAGRRGDLSGAVQSVFALLHAEPGRANRVAHLPARDLGCDGHQSPRFGAPVWCRSLPARS